MSLYHMIANRWVKPVIEKHQEEGRQAVLDWFKRKQEAAAQGLPFGEPIPGQARPTKITDLKNDRGAKAANPSPHAPDERSGHFSCIPNTNEPQDLTQDLPDKNGTGPEDLKHLSDLAEKSR